MRFSSIFILGLTLLSTPAVAKTSYGSYTCEQRVPCDGYRSLSTEEAVQSGNICITKGFGYTNPYGFFDEAAGLDTANCLLPLPNAIPNIVGSPLTPVCCIMTRPDNTCSFHCELVAE